MSTPNTDHHDIKHTALYDLHLNAGAKMVPFAGYSMPVQYKPGILAEHNQTRQAAGLFDVSHMGQARLIGPDHDAVVQALESLIPGDIKGLKPGQMRYSLLLNELGGVLDDLMITRPADPGLSGSLYLVVNAAMKEADFSFINRQLPDEFQLERMEDHALLALQGPKAAECMASFGLDMSAQIFMTADMHSLLGVECHISRSGYTGEDGFEISVPNDQAVALAEQLLQHKDIEPVGLGARDSLRLEAGLCLYGHDITQDITPVEASLNWAISKRRRAAADFPGADRILHQLEHGTDRVRVGLRPKDRTIVREGAEILNEQSELIGHVTSGTFGPTIAGPIAMGYVETPYAALGTELNAVIRGKHKPVVVSAMPFVPHRYYRG